MQAAPKALRLHIGLFGRRNVGKSSILNAITRQNVSIVSDVAGTTTDPVEKPMELLPLGPVLFGVMLDHALSQQVFVAIAVLYVVAIATVAEARRRTRAAHAA